MKKTKKTNWFEYYTYQLLPTTQNQLSIFSLGLGSYSDLKEVKNKIFHSIITSDDFHFKYKGAKLNHKIIYSDEEYIILKIANYKSLKGEKAFKEVHYEHEPSITVVIDNRDFKQNIAIEKDIHVFNTTETVGKFIVKALQPRLAEFLLSPEINNRFSKSDFWDLLEQHQNRIKELKVELIRENLSDIYKTISQDLLDYAQITNSEKIIVTNQALAGNVLENLNQDNVQLNGFVEAASKGTGPISIKVIGYRHNISTRSQTVSKEIDSIEFENLDKDTVNTIIDKIFNPIEKD